MHIWWIWPLPQAGWQAAERSLLPHVRTGGLDECLLVAVAQETHTLLPAQGAVLVTLKKAAALPAVDHNGLSDPYVKFTLDDKHRHSTTVRKSLDPAWNEKFEWIEVRLLLLHPSACLLPCWGPQEERGTLMCRLPETVLLIAGQCQSHNAVCIPCSPCIWVVHRR
jgi:hypothetical protein